MTTWKKKEAQLVFIGKEDIWTLRGNCKLLLTQMPIQFPDLKFSFQVRFPEKGRATASDLSLVESGDDSDTVQ